MSEDTRGAAALSRAVPFTLSGGLVFFIAVFTAAVATRVSHLGAEPFFDELYHILAAQNWLRDGTLTLYEGEYTRTPLYTILTASMFGLAGEPSIAAARAPNVLLGAVLAAGCAVWTRHVAGALAGWIVAILVLFWPSGIHLSQIVRFYALHGLLFFAGAVATYELFRPGLARRRRWAMAAVAVGTLWLARQFQMSTLVGILALGLWAGLFTILPAVLRMRQRVVILLAATVASALVAAAGIMTGTLEALWARYTYSPWAPDPTAYHRVLRETYPLLWPVTPMLAVFAIRANPRPAIFCALLAFFGIALHSFSAQQNIRYIYYLTPFMFILWSIALQAVLPPALAAGRRAIEAVLGRFGTAQVSAAVITLALLFAVLTNGAATQSAKLIMGRVAPPFHKIESWASARDLVAAAVEDGALVVTTNDLATIHYLGGYDVGFSNNWLQSMSRTEFARDPRTGRPMISEASSIVALARTYPRGVFLTSGTDWLMPILRAAEAPGIDWSVDTAGPVIMFAWRSDGADPPEHADDIRAAVERE